MPRNYQKVNYDVLCYQRLRYSQKGSQYYDTLPAIESVELHFRLFY